jgi:16S rRNA (uracil1498-N3)-methyltransferase
LKKDSGRWKKASKIAVRVPRFIATSANLVARKEKSYPNNLAAPALGQSISLSKEDCHHAHDVLRLKQGATIEVFFQDLQKSFICKLEKLTSGQGSAEICAALPDTPLHRVVLVAGMIKPQKCDWLVEKSVELGVAEIHFYFGERSQNPRSGTKLQEREKRLKRIRDAAIKQSYTSCVTEVHIHNCLEQALEELEASNTRPLEEVLRLACQPPRRGCLHSEQQTKQAERQAVRITDIVASVKNLPINQGNIAKSPLEKFQRSAEFFIIIGPEGGFTDSEAELMRKFHYVEASLGPNVLRTETAALVACALVQLAA